VIRTKLQFFLSFIQYRSSVSVGRWPVEREILRKVLKLVELGSFTKSCKKCRKSNTTEVDIDFYAISGTN